MRTRRATYPSLPSLRRTKKVRFNNTSKGMKTNVYKLTKNGYARNPGDGGLPRDLKEPMARYKYKPGSKTTCQRPGFFPFTQKNGKLFKDAINDGVYKPSKSTPIHLIVTKVGDNIAAHALMTPSTKHLCRDVQTKVQGRHGRAYTRTTTHCEPTPSKDSVKLEYLCAAPGKTGEWRGAGTTTLKRALKSETYNGAYKTVELEDNSGMESYYARLGFENTKRRARLHALRSRDFGANQMPSRLRKDRTVKILNRRLNSGSSKK